MQTTRRNFLRTAAASTAVATLDRLTLAAKPGDAVQKQLADDALRPQFHLLPARNWMNDPNGPIYWKGHYHMFFQYNPNAAVWGDMHWNHAVSEDMIHWRHLPVALAPTTGWDDTDGCFTGSAVDDRGTATILYTGVKTVTPAHATLRDGTHTFREVQCLATSSDPQLRTWAKYPRPVIEPPDDPQPAGFRDPFLFRQGNDWILGVAAGHFKTGGCVLLYRSKDLRAWEALHELASGHWTEKESVNPVDSGEMWECPDFFPLGKKHVLLYATAGDVYWESGEFDEKALKFHSERRGLLDHGAYYAQKTQLDAQGNRILWGWIPEKRPDAELVKAGWAGCMALPRVLSLSAEGELEMAVAAEAHSLRGPSFELSPRDSAKNSEVLESIRIENLRAELKWEIAPQAGARLTLADDHGPWWEMALAGRESVATLTVNGVTMELLPGSAKHSFQLFLDGSVAELIVNRRHALTTRIYRQPKGPLRIALNNQVHLAGFEGWQLRAISPDRLTT